MCLTLPKKVISTSGDFVVLDDYTGTRQKVPSMIKLKIGDFCATQRGVVVQKMSKKSAAEIFKMLKNVEKN
jgi:hydrogenase maturation factor